MDNRLQRSTRFANGKMNKNAYQRQRNTKRTSVNVLTPDQLSTLMGCGMLVVGIVRCIWVASGNEKNFPNPWNIFASQNGEMAGKIHLGN